MLLLFLALCACAEAGDGVTRVFTFSNATSGQSPSSLDAYGFDVVTNPLVTNALTVNAAYRAACADVQAIAFSNALGRTSGHFGPTQIELEFFAENYSGQESYIVALSSPTLNTVNMDLESAKSPVYVIGVDGGGPTLKIKPLNMSAGLPYANSVSLTSYAGFSDPAKPYHRLVAFITTNYISVELRTVTGDLVASNFLDMTNSNLVFRHYGFLVGRNADGALTCARSFSIRATKIMGDNFNHYWLGQAWDTPPVTLSPATDNVYLAGFPNGISTTYTSLTAAASACYNYVECRGVTCNTAGSCTMRAGLTLLSSGTAEKTWQRACRYGALQTGYALNGGVASGDATTYTQSLAQRKCCRYADCTGITCTATDVCTVRTGTLVSAVGTTSSYARTNSAGIWREVLDLVPPLEPYLSAPAPAPATIDRICSDVNALTVFKHQAFTGPARVSLTFTIPNLPSADVNLVAFSAASYGDGILFNNPNVHVAIAGISGRDSGTTVDFHIQYLNDGTQVNTALTLSTALTYHLITFWSAHGIIAEIREAVGGFLKERLVLQALPAVSNSVESPWHLFGVEMGRAADSALTCVDNFNVEFGMAPVLPYFADNFNRANGGVGAAYTTSLGPGVPAINANRVCGDVQSALVRTAPVPNTPVLVDFYFAPIAGNNGQNWESYHVMATDVTSGTIGVMGVDGGGAGSIKIDVPLTNTAASAGWSGVNNPNLQDQFYKHVVGYVLPKSIHLQVRDVDDRILRTVNSQNGSAWGIAWKQFGMVVGRNADGFLTCADDYSLVLQPIPAGPRFRVHWPLQTDASCTVTGSTWPGALACTGQVLSGASFSSNSLFLNSPAARVEVPFSPLLNSQSFSIGLWTQLTDYTGGGYASPVTFRDAYTPGFHGYALYCSSDLANKVMVLSGLEGAVWDDVTSQGALCVTGGTTWAHMAITFDGVSRFMRLYFNGVLAASKNTAYAPMPAASGVPLRFGGGGTETAKCPYSVTVPPSTGSYTMTGLTLSSSGNGAVVVRAIAYSDIHIGLAQVADGLSGQFVEIVIGGWSNGGSAIRGSKQGPALVTNNVLLISPINPGISAFWVTLSGGVVTVGPGDVIGVGAPASIMAYYFGTLNVMHVGLSSWDSPITYTCVRTDMPYNWPGAFWWKGRLTGAVFYNYGVGSDVVRADMEATKPASIKCSSNPCGGGAICIDTPAAYFCTNLGLLRVMLDDFHWIYIDGVYYGTGTLWSTAYPYSLTGYGVDLPRVIVIKGTNGGGPGGCLVSVGSGAVSVTDAAAPIVTNTRTWRIAYGSRASDFDAKFSLLNNPTFFTPTNQAANTGGAVNANISPSAQYVWAPSDYSGDVTLAWQRTLTVVADDAFTVYVNGKFLGNGALPTAVTFPLDEMPRQIVVRIQNTGAPGGLLLSASYNFISTPTYWKCANGWRDSDVTGDFDPSLDPALFPAATSVGNNGGTGANPWGLVYPEIAPDAQWIFASQQSMIYVTCVWTRGY